MHIKDRLKQLVDNNTIKSYDYKKEKLDSGMATYETLLFSIEFLNGERFTAFIESDGNSSDSLFGNGNDSLLIATAKP